VTLIPVYVINLDRQADRWDRIKRNAEDIGITLTRCPAIDRKTDFSHERVVEFFGKSNQHNANISPGDICCTLSHVTVWQRILNSDAPAAVILEDDARLDDELLYFIDGDFVDLAQSLDLSCVKLESVPDDLAGRRLRRPLGRFLGSGPKMSSSNIYKLHGPFLGAGAYWISRQAIEDILTSYNHFGLAIDHFLFNPNADGGFSKINVGFVSPAPVLHDLYHFSSDISDHRQTHRQKNKKDNSSLFGAKRKLHQEFHGLRRAIYKLGGSRKVTVTFVGDSNNGS
jgi:glycosyl transferase family 25